MNDESQKFVETSKELEKLLGLLEDLKVNNEQYTSSKILLGQSNDLLSNTILQLGLVIGNLKQVSDILIEINKETILSRLNNLLKESKEITKSNNSLLELAEKLNKDNLLINEQIIGINKLSVEQKDELLSITPQIERLQSKTKTIQIFVLLILLMTIFHLVVFLYK